MKYWVVCKVLFGCCLGNVLMELQMSRKPSTANLVTLSQFLGISLYGFIFTTKFGRVKPSIPLKQYSMLVALFFITSVANNYVYSLHIPPTLHMIIRSASLPASMMVSSYEKRKIPEQNKIVGSILLSCGVAVATYGGAFTVDQRPDIFLNWCLGVLILLSTLFLGALTGLQQEKLFAKYGNHSEEMLFYTNVLPLPMFFGIYPSIHSSVSDISIEDFFIILANIFSQFICAKSVYALATSETSVTVTLILTLRKLLSLIISSCIFKNNITVFHVVGSVFAIFGTCVYFNFFIQKAKTTNKIK